MSRDIYRRFRSSLARRLIPVTAAVFGRWSWRQTQRFGRTLGRLYWLVGRRDRDRALAHLRLAFPEAEEATLETRARRCFEHLAISGCELLHLVRRPPEAAVAVLDIEGWEHVATAQQEAHGVLVVTGHCGNWELLGPAFASRNTPLAAIVRSFEEDWVNEATVGFRTRLGTQVIQRGEPGAARQLLKIFRGQGNLLVLIDHDIKAESVWIPFFGTLASTAIGPAQMAIRHSMIVLPAFCERRADGRHTIRFHPPLELTDDETDVTAAMTRAVEEQIRRVPEQWTWMHKRWRRPEGGEEVLGS